MFEQSLLIDPTSARKTGALALSVTMQTAAVAVLIAIPLIIGDRLPLAPRFIALALPSPPPAPQPEIERQPITQTTTAHRVYKGFTAPTRIVPLSQIPAIDIADAPPVLGPPVTAGVPGGIGAPSYLTHMFDDVVKAPPVKPAPAVVDKPKPVARVPVGGDVQAAKLIRKVMPVYPPLARQARISGTVRLMGVVGKDGSIQQLQLVSGHPLLAGAALEAVRQWLYRPTLLNGQPVEVIAPIDVIFTLGQ